MHVRRSIGLGSLIFALPALLFVIGPADAQKSSDPGSNEESADEQGQIIDEVVSAYRLVDFGRKHKAPEALLTAATLFRKVARVEMEKVTEQPEIASEDGGNQGALVNEDAPATDFDAEANALLAEAMLMGKEAKLDLGPLVNNIKNRKEYRSPIGGPRTKDRFIGGHQRDSFRFQLRANAPTHFGFRANVPMRVTVVRNDTNHVLMDRSGTADSAAWRPQDRDKVVGITIQIRNQAKVRGHYHFWLR